MAARIFRTSALPWAAAVSVLLALSAALAAAPACAADLGNGKVVFATYCSDCHSIKEGKDKKGPSLFATFGQPAAKREGFAYSGALKSSGIVWTADKLDAYIADPRAVVPGGKMKTKETPNAAERADLIAYLQSVH